MNHTPGPWRAKRLANFADPGHVILWPSKGGQHMRRVDYSGNFIEADATLIAAAPELLAALADILANPNDPSCCAKGRAAIAKATEEA